MRVSVHVPVSSEASIAAMLELLTRMNETYLRHTRTPAIYASGVRYRREVRPREDWLMVPYILELGHGDCEDLACWRAAELRLAGESGARPIAIRPRPSLWHIVVRRADGRIEDPSKRLGMGRA